MKCVQYVHLVAPAFYPRCLEDLCRNYGAAVTAQNNCLCKRGTMSRCGVKFGQKRSVFVVFGISQLSVTNFMYHMLAYITTSFNDILLCIDWQSITCHSRQNDVLSYRIHNSFFKHDEPLTTKLTDILTIISSELVLCRLEHNQECLGMPLGFLCSILAKFITDVCPFRP